MALQTIEWGKIALLMDQSTFQEGYKDGRRYYFTDGMEAEGTEEASGVLTVSSLLRVIAIPDQAGHYQLDDGCDFTTLSHGVEELLGVLVGYLSGPLHPETQEERNKREAENIVHEMTAIS